MKMKFVFFAFISVFLLSAILETQFLTLVSASSEINEPVYYMIAEFYDNRHAVVTLTADDWNKYCEQAFEDMCSMLNAKKIYRTGGIITSQNPNWTQIQHWLNQGYTEAASHSRTHPNTVYEDYDSEIGGSKVDIIDNLTLPPIFSFNDNEYVYAWIEPFGESDSTVREKLASYMYLGDRDVTADSGWAEWNSTSGLFNRIGYSIRMGSDGISDITTLNNEFDSVYNAGGIYHLMCHPTSVNWEPGGYADSHTDYLKERLDIWYVNFGLLYLYRWIATQDTVQITSTGSGQDKIFKISISSTERQNYGAGYPVTYVFDIPSDWTSGYVYYRYQESNPWMLMENKSSTDFFNGINASRFDFADQKAYVSVGFGNVSNDIYLQIRYTPIVHDIAITDVTVSPTNVNVGQPVSITVEAENEGTLTETFDVSLYYDTELIETRTGISLDAGAITTLSFTWDTIGVAEGTYSVKVEASTVPGEQDITNNLYTDGQVVVIDMVPPSTSPIVISPNGGGIWSGTRNITWTPSTDPDPITYEIEYSYDGGTWHPLAGGISETSYQWDTTTYQDSANYLIRVSAYDGEFYSDWDPSDSVFTIDNTAPTVTDHTPTATYVPVTTIMTASFSEAMDKISVQNAFSISPPVAVSFSWSDNTLIFTPSSNLAYGTTYSLTIGTGSMDPAGNLLHLPYNWQFNTLEKPLEASFTYSPTEPVVDEIVTFNASNYDPPNGTITSYTWDFGDGTSDSGMIVTHAYSAEGTYTVNLAITLSPPLGSAYATTDLAVSPLVNDIAIIGVTVSSTSVKAGNPIFINITIINQGDSSEIFNVTVYYNSVVIDTRMDVSLGAGSTTILTFTWNTKDVAAGTYTISAEASVVLGEIDTADNVFINGKVTVSPLLGGSGGGGGGGGGNKRPRANFMYSPSTPTDVDTIQFTDESNDPDGSIASWLWDFGDGSNATERNPTHRYADDGNYTVTLTVRDDDGAKGQITEQFTVLNAPPKADFTINSPPNLASQNVIQLTDQSSDSGLIVSWLWDFGDETTSTDKNPTHRYEVLGTYTVKLIVTDDDGATDTALKIYDSLPPTTTNNYEGLWHSEDFTIILTASDYSGVQATYYKINDGPTESVQVDGQPHITTEGNNELEYWSVDRAGNKETPQIIDVKLDKTVPVANAGGDRSVAQNFLVTFDASKSSDNVGIVSYEWDFGDGSKGTGLTTTHTYKETGTYIIWLMVKDAADNINTSSVSVTVLKDTDGDGTPDATDTDDDDDGMPDTWELSYGLNPFDMTDAALNLDGDGLTNLEEYKQGTDPTSYFSPFPQWIFVLVAAFGTIAIIISRYAIAPPR